MSEQCAAYLNGDRCDLQARHYGGHVRYEDGVEVVAWGWR